MSSSTHPRRVRRTLLVLALAGGVAGAGATLASAADTPPAPSATGAGSDGDGRITAVDDSSLTLADASGASLTYTLSSGTTVHQGPETDLAVSDLTVGERVHVRGSDGAATDVDVHPAHIDGTVTSVDGDRITVTDPDGFTREISTSGGTTYEAGDGGTAEASTVKAGVAVHAEGTVDADGTTLDATAVVVGARPRPAGPPARVGKGGGKGGPPAPPAGGPAVGAGTGEAPAPPSDAPSAGTPSAPAPSSLATGGS